MTTEIAAGRELDVLIATEVMGWVPWLEQRGNYQHVVFQRTEREPWKNVQSSYQEAASQRYQRIAVSDIDYHKHIMEYVGRDFGPSTTYEGMGLVLERMRDLDFVVTIDLNDIEAQVEMWTGDTRARVDETAVAATLPHAVCLAALKAVRA